ncbi:MAG TPA: hypothetical protein VFN35_11315 [Ktedonobacteraceae bacterium]|nr:hypothetical protein [Ktedonobacteraceae bacterium]
MSLIPFQRSWQALPDDYNDINSNGLVKQLRGSRSAHLLNRAKAVSVPGHFQQDVLLIVTDD